MRIAILLCNFINVIYDQFAIMACVSKYNRIFDERFQDNISMYSGQSNSGILYDFLFTKQMDTIYQNCNFKPP